MLGFCSHFGDLDDPGYLVRWPKSITVSSALFKIYRGNFRLWLQRSTFNCDSTFQQWFVISASNTQSQFSTSNYNCNFKCDNNSQPWFNFSTLNCDCNFQPKFVFWTLNCKSNFQPRFDNSTFLTVIATFNRDLHFQRLWFQLQFIIEIH